MTGCYRAGAVNRITFGLEGHKFMFDPLEDRQIDRIRNYQRSRHAVHLLQIGQGDRRRHVGTLKLLP